ncbi:MAG: selenocysteine-specific translation elongation factor [Pirellulaceae bacterium]|nr:selenocysteine-specific translation elongation factor [Pirellulaceae bacterium]
MITDLILGTAGHIDHGKTSLIKSLTGVDTDRLPEEKKRGITIELGFAELELDDFRLGIVDVPGHEKFVRQMLAGATGMDIAVLVIAADDSVKPQTREHFEVLRMLDLSAGLIVLTKCDLADPDWIELVEQEARELVEDSFLAEAPIIRTSSATGQGIPELKAALLEAANHVAQNRQQSISEPFRMAIDRAFTIAGHGTVVTGSVSSGQANVGDQMMIEPNSIEVRIRGLHNHDRVVDSVHRGQRAAINLAGIHHDQVMRGQELASAGHLIASRLITVRLDILQSAVRPLKNRARIRLHIGTAEVLATVSLLDAELVTPGETTFAQLFLSEPVVSTWNQPFVLRSESPIMTIAGGRVVVPVAAKIRRANQSTLQYLQDLTDKDALRRASAAIYFSGSSFASPLELARTAGIPNGETVFQQLIDDKLVVPLHRTGHKKIYFHSQLLDEAGGRIRAALERRHDLEPLKSVFDRTSLAAQFNYLGPASVFDAILERLNRTKQVRLTANGVGLAARGPSLSKGEQELLKQLIQRYLKAGFQPPTVKECQKESVKNQQSVPQLISLAATDGDLIEIGDKLYLHCEVEQQLRDTLSDALGEGVGMTLSEIRELLKTTRKYAVPICEYLDRTGFTDRDGDLRRLNKRQATI